MALPWKKETKDTRQETPLVKESPEKAAGFDATSEQEISEKKVEQPVEASKENELSKVIEDVGEAVGEAIASSVGAVVPVLQPVIKDEVTKEIENILSEDLTDLFLKMNPQQQEEFRIKGEETASKIRLVLASAKINVKKILSLIGEWLKMIPGVNRFFLEQEAKIKTDKILLNTEEFKKEGKL